MGDSDEEDFFTSVGSNDPDDEEMEDDVFVSTPTRGKSRENISKVQVCYWLHHFLLFVASDMAFFIFHMISFFSLGS